MVHCGHEPTAVDHTFGSLKGFWATVRASFVGPKILKPEDAPENIETSYKEAANA